MSMGALRRRRFIHATVETPPVEPGGALTSLPLTVTRMDGGSGSVRVSNGVPLGPGDATTLPRVMVNGAEVASYVEPLGLSHQIGGGGYRSLLVQFDVDPATVSTCTVDWTGPRTLSSTKTSTTYTNSLPPCVALPAMSHLLTARILGHVALSSASVTALTSDPWVTLFETSGGTLGTGSQGFNLQFDTWYNYRIANSFSIDATSRFDLHSAAMAWGIRHNAPTYVHRAMRMTAAYVVIARAAQITNPDLPLE